MFFKPKYLMEENKDTSGAGGQQNLPLDKNKPSDSDAAIKAAQDKAAALEKKLADIEAKEKKSASEKKAAEEKLAADKLVADGEAKKVIEQKTKELADAQAKLDAINQATQKRIDAMVEKMSDASKKKIALVKDSMSVDKLLEFVEAEMETSSQSNNTPLPGGTPGGASDPGKFKLSAEAEQVLNSGDISTANLGLFTKTVDPLDPTSWKLTIPIDKLKDNLRGRATRPVKMSTEEWQKRSGSRR